MNSVKNFIASVGQLFNGDVVTGAQNVEALVKLTAKVIAAGAPTDDDYAQLKAIEDAERAILNAPMKGE